MGGYFKFCPKISNGDEEGASGQSTCKVPCADEELVSQDMLQGDVSVMSDTKMCDTKFSQGPGSEAPSLIEMLS